jgi:glycosyltransferase involved in cell wall biosynthesis
MAPLRVCMVHFSEFLIDSRIQRQAKALAERGDEVDCVCLDGPEEIAVGPGRIRLNRIRAEKARGGARSYLLANGRFLAGALRAVTRLDRSRRFDVVEVHNMPDVLTLTALRPKLRGAPVILNIHDTFPELFATTFGRPAAHPLVRMARLEERLSAKLADRLIFVTDQARGLLHERGVGNGNAEVVMNSPDEGVFGPPRGVHRLPESGSVRAVYHGGVAPRFGADLLVEAFGLLAGRAPRLSLELLGAADSFELRTLAARVAPSNVRVAARPTPYKEIPGQLENCHLGIVPTVRDEFTELLLPVKLLECVHMGLPVVAARLPVLEHYFGENELRFFRPGSAESLAAAIEAALADPQGSALRAERAQERLAEIAWSEQRRRYLGLVDELTTTSR